MKLNRRSAWARHLEEAAALPFEQATLPDTIPNGSFEDGDGVVPAAWTLLRGAMGVSTEWCAAGGSEGGRCIRISPRGGGASWYSQAVPIGAGAEYVFRCRTRRAGEPGWAQGCEISWVSLVFGDVLDLLTVDAADLEPSLAIYFRLLNLGLRLGVAGSSGACVDRGEDVVGAIATFVRAERLNMDSIAVGYEAQRTMASNGPLLRLRVNEKDVGGTVAGPGVRIQAEAFSNWGLTRLEVLFNGRIVAEATPGELGWARVNAEWRAEGSGWMLARAIGPGHPALHTKVQHAITSPIYIEVPGRPLVPLREDAD